MRRRVVSPAKTSNMGFRLAYLLFSLHLLHSALSNHTLYDEQPFSTVEPVVLNKQNAKCVNTCSSYSIHISGKLLHIEYASKVNWYQAGNNCRKLGGSLINVESSMEMQLISSILPMGDYWTSSNCLANGVDFISLTTGKAMPYSKWTEGQPDNKKSDEKCVVIVNGFLNAEKCDSLNGYVCQANQL